MTDEELLRRATSFARLIFTQDFRFKGLAEKWQREGKTFSGLLFGNQFGVTVGALRQGLGVNREGHGATRMDEYHPAFAVQIRNRVAATDMRWSSRTSHPNRHPRYKGKND
jgi:hypothetical protein